MKETKRTRRLNLRELIAKSEAVWVTNNTGTHGISDEPGNVVFQVGSGNSIDKVIIPPGDDPVCISDQVDPESLKSCRDLFKLINRGVLTLLDPDNAEEYYNSNDARREAMQEKLDRITRGFVDPDAPKPKSIRDREQNAEDAIKIKPKVLDICQHCKHEAVSEKIALETLIEQSRSLTQDDFSYIATNGYYPNVKQWARDHLEATPKGALNSKKSKAKKESDPIEKAVAEA